MKINRRKSALLKCIKASCISAIIASSLAFNSYSAPVDTYGALSVSRNVINGKNGNPVQLRGMSLYWSQAKAGRDFFNANIVNWLATDWHANIIRAAMGIEGDWSVVEKGYLSDPNTNKARVTAVVDAAIAKGIYVIIDWHDHNATAHQSQAISFFTEMAKNYGKKPHVIYEIFNEPDNESWDQIKSYSTEVIKAIRAQDPDNLIIVGTPKYSSDVETAANSPITGYSNIAYSFHMYASEKWHHDNYMTAANNAINKGIPLFVTEWGLTEASGSGNINVDWVNQFVNWMEQKKLSSCNWAIADLSETSSALKAGTWDSQGNLIHKVSTSGNWNTSDLSQSGNYMRDKLRSLNPAYTPAVNITSGEKAHRSLSNAVLKMTGNNYQLLLGNNHSWETATILTIQGKVISRFVLSKGTSTISLGRPLPGTVLVQLKNKNTQELIRFTGAK